VIVEYLTAVLQDENDSGWVTAVAHITKARNTSKRNNQVSIDGLPTGLLKQGSIQKLNGLFVLCPTVSQLMVQYIHETTPFAK
jgi:hypothetical protein